MNPTPNLPSAEPDGIEIVTTRIFAAPRDLVFRAFENPEHLAQWWGPTGFTNTITQFDLRAGGAWRLVMHGPDGTDYDNASEFVDVVKPEKIVVQHLEPMHRFRMTMTYAETAPNKTRLTWRMALARTAENERLKSFLVQANEQNFDRLAAHLEKMKA